MKTRRLVGVIVGLFCASCGGQEFSAGGVGGAPMAGAGGNADGGVSSGGHSPSGGGPAAGGTSATGGHPAGTGGDQGDGGVPASGGATGTGGSSGGTGTGGGPPADAGVPTGGKLATGGMTGTGGVPSTGGMATGGNPAKGGATTGGTVSGGSPTTGGANVVGGSPTTGGTATGGKAATGGTATGGKAATGGTATGGASTGGSSTGGAGGSGSYPECTTAKDCTIFDDCCACVPAPVTAIMPSCGMYCTQSNCAARGIRANEVDCIAGRCVFTRTCNPAGVMCSVPAPACATTEAPLIVNGCYAGGCAKVEDCADVGSCDFCKLASLSCATFQTLGPSYHCVTTPDPCSHNPTCACMGICTGAGLSCVQPDSTALTCQCPGC
jgi:hypothetical protein